MMKFRRCLLVLVMVMLFSINFMAQAQEVGDVVSMTVETGYDNYFRPDYWLPLRVRVSNAGDSITGQIVVRPATSGRAVSNTYTTPIDLPTGSEKTAFLYVLARPFPARLVVELLDSEGVRVAEQSVGIVALDPHDALHVVVSGTGANSIPLSDVAPGGYNAGTARWEISNIPTEISALLAINTLIFYDANTDELTVDQRDAIREWVTLGGHLIVIGGPAWAQTSNALVDLLPMTPENNRNLDNLAGIEAFVGDDATLTSRTFVTVGTIKEGSEILAQTADGTPLIVRGALGAGTVDYLTADPTLAPLRDWDQLREVWLMMMSQRDPQPAWRRGFLDLQDAARALAILPDVDLLPSVTSMIFFITAYILLIGPVNYLLLSRINRREWAWVTIPLTIVGFTAIAWTVGFNLRGTEMIVSRLNVIQSFAGVETARQDSLLAVLSPRRDIYQLNIPAGNSLRVMPSLQQNNIFQQDQTQSTSDIVQTDYFAAQNIAIDGGIFANFATMGTTTNPQIGGNITFRYDPETGLQTLLGVVRNDSDFALENVIILTRNQFYALAEPLEAGDIVNFSSVNMQTTRDTITAVAASGSPFEQVFGLDLGNNQRNSFATYASLETTRILLGDSLSLINPRRQTVASTDLIGTELQNRQRAFVRSFLRDQYNTQAIGHDAYVIGWAVEPQPMDIELVGYDYRAVDTTLIVAQLATNIEPAPSSAMVTIEPDQFVWTVRARDNAEGSLNDMTLINPGSVAVRFMPISDAVLANVNQMIVELDRSSSYGRDVQLALWNWETDEWETLPSTVVETYTLENPARFLGPNNLVDMRLTLDRDLGAATITARLRDLQITQIGNF